MFEVSYQVMLGAFTQALSGYLSLEFWLIIFAGLIIGMLFGALPGLSALVALTMVTPFLFLMTPETALPFFMAIIAANYTTGSIAAILLNVPGTTVNAATLLDGFPMTVNGKGDRALGAALTASGLGGTVGVLFALIMIPFVFPLILALKSPEMFALILMGLSCVGVLTGKSPIKGMISACFGLLISIVGIHAITGVTRFTFGTVFLISGVPLVPALLGLYCVPEMLDMDVKGGIVANVKDLNLSVRGVIEGCKDVFRHWWLFLRSAVLGWIIGAIPGVGGTTAVFIVYGQAKQTSKHPELFGTGIVEGVIAPESANNAKEGGALLTSMALGIPGSLEWVVILGSLLLLGIRPGPDMITKHLPLTFQMLLVLFSCNVIGAFICILLASRLAKIATISSRILLPVITVVIFIGAFAEEERILSLFVLLIFGLLGFVMEKLDFSRAAMLLGFILGDLLEKYFFLSVGSAGPLFLLRPISLSIILLTLVVFLYNSVKNLLLRRKG